MDISANRAATKYTRRELFLRVFWSVCRPLFRFSPRLAWGWRNALLRFFGSKIGRHVHIFPSAVIFYPWEFEIGDWSSVAFDVLVYNLGPVRIGANVTISQRAHLCAGTHDFRDPAMPLLKPSIAIADNVWVCADAFVGPGVTVAQGAVVAARAVVVRDVEEGCVVGGNPARVIGKR